MTPSLGTRLRRGGFRIAYVGLVAGSWLLRPTTRGVKCLVVRGDDVLLVRHCYGPRRWDLPGGFCRRGEPFAAAARRELAEELGIADARWTDVGELRHEHQGRHETLHGFRAELPGSDGPAPEPRSAEVVAARWFPRAALPERRAAIVDTILRLDC